MPCSVCSADLRAERTSFRSPIESDHFMSDSRVAIFSGGSGVSDFFDWTCWRCRLDEDDLSG